MKIKFLYILILLPFWMSAQEKQDTIYKKRVLETTELDILTSFYTQNGDHAAVTGGIGTEELRDYATNINISIPVNDDDVLTIDGTVSAYTSASSSNLNTFSGASKGEINDDRPPSQSMKLTGTPWLASTGASKSDVWLNANVNYSHSSDNRNNVYSGGISVSNEFDYSSLGTNISYLSLFNQQNTSLNLGAKIYIDKWKPVYPSEIRTYFQTGGNLNALNFNNVDILDQNGQVINKNGNNRWRVTANELIIDKSRNTYTFTLSFSQILSKRMQVSLISEMTLQKGWLANPLQRVYFADRPNFYIGNPNAIPYYTDKSNTSVFQLADDIERLPHSRTKFPFGVRWHYYINENLVVKTYYRYYFDDWGLQSHTFNIELPIKIGMNWTFYPDYRYYTQTGIKYFAPYETHISTEKFYTSDYDLAPFTANQFGLGIKYKDITTHNRLFGLGIKNISINYHYYLRNNNFNAHIISLGTKLVFD